MFNRGRLIFFRTTDQSEAWRAKRKMRLKQALVSVAALAGLAFYVYFLRSSSQKSMLDIQAAQDGLAVQPDDAMIVRMAAFLNASGKVGQEDNEEEMDGFQTDLPLDHIPPPGESSPEKQKLTVKMEPMDDPSHTKGDDDGLETDVIHESSSTFHPSDIKRAGNNSSQQEIVSVKQEGRSIEIMPQQEQPPVAMPQQPPAFIHQEPLEHPQKPPGIKPQHPPVAMPQQPPVFIPQKPQWIKPPQPPVFIPQQPLEVNPQKPQWIKPPQPPVFIPQQPPVAIPRQLRGKLRQSKDSNRPVVDAAKMYENVRQRGHQFVQQNRDSGQNPPFRLLPDNTARFGVGPNPAAAQNGANNQRALDGGHGVNAVNSDIGGAWSRDRVVAPRAGQRSINSNQANVAFNRR